MAVLLVAQGMSIAKQEGFMNSAIERAVGKGALTVSLTPAS